jgi:predicted acyltransferase
MQKRLTSLDAFRGFTVAAMIMVNFPGNSDFVFFTLRHSIWNALSFTDHVAPFFLFIIGVSIHFSYSNKLPKEKPALYKKIILRALKIFLIGMFLNLMPTFNLSEIRWTGTLHRIAIVFLICSILSLHTNWKQQLIIFTTLLLGYWIIMTAIPYPGEGKVMLEPGKNIAAYIDSLYLPGKMWQKTWDPEGILSIVPTCCTTMIGMLVGKILKSELHENLRLNYLMIIGVALSILGYFVGLSFPVNENIWSSSFVLVTGGFACLIFASMYFIFDVLPYSKYSKIGVVFGVNAITAYVLGDLLGLVFYGINIGGNSINMHFFNYFNQLGVMPELISLIYALLFVSIVSIPCWILYKKRIIIKV